MLCQLILFFCVMCKSSGSSTVICLINLTSRQLSIYCCVKYYSSALLKEADVLFILKKVIYRLREILYSQIESYKIYTLRIHDPSFKHNIFYRNCNRNRSLHDFNIISLNMSVYWEALIHLAEESTFGRFSKCRICDDNF